MDALFAGIEGSLAAGRVVVDEREAAAGAAWLRADRGGERRRAHAERIAAMEAAGQRNPWSRPGRPCRWRAGVGAPRPALADASPPVAASTPGLGVPPRHDPPAARLSSYFLPTVKEAPADAEAVSHRLICAGRPRAPARCRHVDLAAGDWRAHHRGRGGRAGETDAIGAGEMLMPV